MTSGWKNDNLLHIEITALPRPELEALLEQTKIGPYGIEIPEDKKEPSLRMMGDVLDLIERFEKEAHKRPREVPNNIDAVWVVSAPGVYSTNPKFSQPENKAASDGVHLYRWQVGDDGERKWTEEMYKHRVLAGATLVNQVTAGRLEKKVENVTKEDILKHGPHFIYNPDPKDKGHIEAILAQESVKLPREKVLIFYYLDYDKGEKAQEPITNLVDQVQSFHVPESLNPRKIAVVSHSADLVRLLYIWGEFKGTLPKTASVYPFPIKMLERSKEEFTLKTIRGILENWLHKNRGADKPIDFEF